ncbi:hypothetical protein [Streptomyces sp. NPDC050856]|uniref:hypothetical protein n=1 Tax=Streptomyces sp. NPDC050856 TaxID=3154939 RepID=UPI003405084E
MSRGRTLSRKKKLALLVGAAAVAGGTAVTMTGTSQASVACDGLASALGDNERFIAGQRAAPDARSEARIANRLAVIAEIERKQAASGCRVGEGRSGPGVPDAGARPSGAGDGASAAPGGRAGTRPPAGTGSPGGRAPGAGRQAGGEVVCPGSTVTLSGEGGAPAASSDRFPPGTRLKVTNLDNARSTVVEVTSVSGSCVLLNDAAFEQVREPGRFLVRKARIERVG